VTEPSRIQAIRQRAYAIWETAGRPDGRDCEHWLQAEAEMPGLQPQQNHSRRPRARAGRRPTAAKPA
jgi:hypothetical protein